MVDWLTFSLRAWDPRARAIAAAEFLDRIVVVPGDPAVVEDGPGTPRVRLLSVAREDFAQVDTTLDAAARPQAFAAAVRNGLVRAAAWLDRQEPAVFEALRAAGRKTDVFVGGWIEMDQFDLDLPPEFLQACGRLGLTISICTND